ncbi:MAG: 1-acyl-sn-glycerol-3-phosphate acyltransferase [Deltaproteobacteria bacterium]|nr:1-acyl-sn-glycerol-3-phosphate acyltransferase [Deltaproteobacteria bacterium]
MRDRTDAMQSEGAAREATPSRWVRRGRQTARRIGVALCVGLYFAASPIGYAIFAGWAAIPARDPARRAEELRAIVTLAFRSMHAFLRWARIVDFDPAEHAGRIPDRPCVLVANHPTLMDISALLAADSNLVYPVKSSLFNRFWARPLFRSAGLFEGAGQDPLRVRQMIDAATGQLAAGRRVIIFPEGTRSPERGIHEFGRVAFEIARRAGVPIVPLVITCRPRFLGKTSGFSRPPAALPRLRIRVLEPLDPVAKPWSGSSSRTLRDIVARQISTELERLDGSSVPDGRP